MSRWREGGESEAGWVKGGIGLSRSANRGESSGGLYQRINVCFLISAKFLPPGSTENP